VHLRRIEKLKAMTVGENRHGVRVEIVQKQDLVPGVIGCKARLLVMGIFGLMAGWNAEAVAVVINAALRSGGSKRGQSEDRGKVCHSIREGRESGEGAGW
jgi:hypothetical protein